MFYQIQVESKITPGIIFLITGSFLSGLISFLALFSVIQAKDSVLLNQTQEYIKLQEMKSLVEEKITQFRSYLLTGDRSYWASGQQARSDYLHYLADLKKGPLSQRNQAFLQKVEERELLHQKTLLQLQPQLTDESPLSEAQYKQRFDLWINILKPHTQALRTALQDITTSEKALLHSNLLKVEQDESHAMRFILISGIIILVVGLSLSFMALSSLRQIKVTEQELKKAVRFRDEFISLASHELKTPLTSLKLQVQLAKRKIQLPNSPESHLDKMKQLLELSDLQVNKMAHLINSMLDISQLIAGELTIRPEYFDLKQLLSEIFLKLSPLFQQRNCPLQYSFDQQRPIVGPWDRSRLEHAFTHILTNAALYGQGRPIEVHLSLKGAESVECTIRDYGCGIAKENQKRIFERFERVIPPNHVSGLGLGLYFTQQIIHLHGGSIRLESDINQGACFIITLPLRRASEDDSNILQFSH